MAPPPTLNIYADDVTYTAAVWNGRTQNSCAEASPVFIVERPRRPASQRGIQDRCLVSFCLSISFTSPQRRMNCVGFASFLDTQGRRETSYEASKIGWRKQ